MIFPRRRSRSKSPRRGIRGDSRERRDFRTNTGRGGRYGNRGGGRFGGRDDGRNRRTPDRTTAAARFYGQDPLKTLEAWKEAQNDEVELNEEQYEEQYQAYRDTYMSELESAFFDFHEKSEWFRERYGPREVSNRRSEMRRWAHSEASLFAQQLRRAPGAFITSASLSPADGLDGKWTDISEEGKGRKRTNAMLDGDIEDGFDAKAIVGHGIFAVQIRRVPAWCTRRMLVETIQTEMGDIAFERLALSDATKNRDTEYARGAFVMFASDEDARTAARRLNKAVVTEPIVPLAQPASEDIIIGSTSSPRTFSLQAFAYRLRGSVTLDPSLSVSTRIAHDAEQAILLAYALDEEKGLGQPEEPDGSSNEILLSKRIGLHSILRDPEVISALEADKEPICAKLDLACAYLKRVHLYVYYGAQQCASEGELLGVKTYRRSAALPSEKNGVGAAAGEPESSTQKEENELMEVDSAPKVEGIAEKIDVAALHRIEEARQSSEIVAIEEKQCEEFLAAEEEVLNKWVIENTILTEEMHARCGIPDCGKLFKDATYVHKHLRNKHIVEATNATADVALPYLKEAFAKDTAKPLPTVPLDVGNGGRQWNPSAALKDHPIQDPFRNDPQWENQRDDASWEQSREPNWDHQRETFVDSMSSMSIRPDLSQPLWTERGPGPQRYGGRGPFPGGFHGRGGRSYSGRGPPVVQVKHEDAVSVDPRQILSYVDVDAPKVTAPMLDYGGAFPPPKKRVKKNPPAVSTQQTVPTGTSE